MKRIFAANWKLFKTPNQTRDFLNQFLPEASNIDGEVVIFPQASSWEAASNLLKNNKISWGAQNTYFEAQGAFTGENSAQVLRELGGKYVLVGHSERRKIFCENDELLAKKVNHVLSLGLVPMLCIGETLEERERNKTNEVNERQLKSALQGVNSSAPLVVAYEPVWAIGTGKVATPEQAEEAHQFIKKVLKNLGFTDTPVLYGGSVKPDNAQELLSRPGIDGFLVGGASLEPKSFLAICSVSK
jgi:triosephosphate isomerase